MKTAIASAWSAVSEVLRKRFSFYDIKGIAGLAGVDMTRLAHIVQSSGSSVSKGELISGISGIVAEFDEQQTAEFISIVLEEAIGRVEDIEVDFASVLTRLGWQIKDGNVVPAEIMDMNLASELSPECQADLLKSAVRFRDGDLSGAITAACGAVDSVTRGATGESEDTGRSGSFQEKYKRTLRDSGVIDRYRAELLDAGWSDSDANILLKNLEGALNQSAYVMQSIRSKMGDVHGTKEALKDFVFHAVNWAHVLVRTVNR